MTAKPHPFRPFSPVLVPGEQAGERAKHPPAAAWTNPVPPGFELRDPLRPAPRRREPDRAAAAGE